MQIIRTKSEMQSLASRWRCEGETIGFVPTMGALHEGHLSLGRAAREGCNRFVASLFVNPAQFGPREDLKTYPQPFERDCQLLKETGCDAVFAPSTTEMYGNQTLARGARTWVEVSQLGEMWEEVLRPGHVRGVATVVTQLFNITMPHRAYFGEKDYQQLKVIQRLVADLHFNIQIVPMPTVREADGLALSSRNAYLSPAERKAAPTLFRSLQKGVELARAGERDVSTIGAEMQAVCAAEPLVQTQYIAIVDGETLSQMHTLDDRPMRALISARVGQTRLIDNLPI